MRLPSHAVHASLHQYRNKTQAPREARAPPRRARPRTSRPRPPSPAVAGWSPVRARQARPRCAGDAGEPEGSRWEENPVVDRRVESHRHAGRAEAAEGFETVTSLPGFCSLQTSCARTPYTYFSVLIFVSCLSRLRLCIHSYIQS